MGWPSPPSQLVQGSNPDMVPPGKAVNLHRQAIGTEAESVGLDPLWWHDGVPIANREVQRLMNQLLLEVVCGDILRHGTRPADQPADCSGRTDGPSRASGNALGEAVDMKRDTLRHTLGNRAFEVGELILKFIG